MGACASVPKAMRDEAAVVGPPPKQRMDDPHTTHVVQDEKKAVQKTDQSQSLGALLVKGETPKHKGNDEFNAEVLAVSEPTVAAEEKATNAAAAAPAEVAAVRLEEARK